MIACNNFSKTTNESEEYMNPWLTQTYKVMWFGHCWGGFKWVIIQFLRGGSVREWIAAHNPKKQLTQVGVIKDIEDGKDDNNSVALALSIEWGFILLLIKILEFDFAYELLRFDKNVRSD